MFHLVSPRPRPSATCPGRAFAVPAWDRRGSPRIGVGLVGLLKEKCLNGGFGGIPHSRKPPYVYYIYMEYGLICNV